MQKECDKSTAIAEEALQAAASEVSAINDQLEQEALTRETLQTAIRKLEHKLVTEQQKNKLSSSEWMMNRKQWQRDTNNLIVSIQQECNTVFTQNLIRNRNESPRSVTIINDNCNVSNDDENTTIQDDKSDSGTGTNDKSNSVMPLDDDSYISRIEHGVDVAFPIHRTPWKRNKHNSSNTNNGTQLPVITKTTSYNSPLDVSQALDETEAMVRSLVAK
jgi:hypothetical protein